MHGSKSFVKAPRYLLRKLNILDELRKLDDFDTFIDMGCGAGDLACSLAERGYRGIAYDYSKDAVATANKMKKLRGIKDRQLLFELQNSDESTRSKKSVTDLVICCEVLEHIKDDKKLLSKLVQMSRRYILISVPAKQKLFDSSDQAVGHFRRYEKAELTRLLNEQDLTILKFINYGFPFTNIVRVIRKVAFNKKLRHTQRSSMDSKSKQSGINPVKLPQFLNKLNTETLIKPLYMFSRIFNSTNLGEGYLVICSKNNPHNT